MFRLSNILIFILLAVTLFLIVIHIRKADYYENPSKGITENIYSGQTTISVNLAEHQNDDYIFNLSFHHIKSEIIVNEINIHIEETNDNSSDSLELVKILPYSGMHPWDIPEYKSFAEIPDSLRKLNSESNPYFAFDFILKPNAKFEASKFTTKINLNISENGTEKTITKELVIRKVSKTELRPLDAHSDISFPLIPIFAVLTIILFIRRALSEPKKIKKG